MATISVGVRLLRQCGKPDGWFGRLTLKRMSWSHSKLAEWGLAHVPAPTGATILDVGCGGGKTVAKLASRASEGKVFGVDYSEESVRVSRRTNQRLIESGRVEILNASVSQLPFADESFDLVTAVETHYYWPDLNSDVREVLRVLKPGGTLAMIAEAYRGGKRDRMLQHLEALERRGIMKYTCLTIDEHRELLSGAGFVEVEVFENYDRGWVCAVGRRLAAPNISRLSPYLPL